MSNSTLPSVISKIFLPLMIIVVSTLGILDAGYITYEKATGHIPKCSAHFQCEAVLTSSWANVGPIPLSALGLFYYSVVWTLGISLYLGREVLVLPANVRFKTRHIMMLLTTVGLFFSAYLVGIMAFVIHGWCLYCLFSAAFSSILFCLCVASLRTDADQSTRTLSFRRQLFRASYLWLLKPIFFQFDAEAMHNFMTSIGKLLGRYDFTRALTQFLFDKPAQSFSVTLNDIHFPNPIGLSAGFDYNGELPTILSAVGFGFTTIGTVTNHPYAGNQKPRLGRYPKSKALLVNKGFKSLGAAAIIRKLEHKQFSLIVGISIGSTNQIFASLKEQIADIMHTFKLFEASAVKHSYYELNISCPNTKGGQPFTTPERLESLLKQVDTLHISKPIYLKMPIDYSESETLALLAIADKHKIVGVIFGNLTKDRSNPDVHPVDRQQWQTAIGNLSGKPTWNRSNALIALTKKTYRSRFTIIGTGGIHSPEDAVKKIELGADLVQLITGMIYEGPQLINEIHATLLAQKHPHSKQRRST